MIINFKNVERVVFADKNVRKLLPEFYLSFETWDRAIKDPSLRSLSKKTIIDFINSIKHNHLCILSEYFNESVHVESIDCNIVKNMEVNIKDLAYLLEENSKFNFSLSVVDGVNVLVTFWR